VDQRRLLDSGATAVRFGLHVAGLCGIDLSGAPEKRLAVGGALLDARMADVDLRVADAEHSYEWRARRVLRTVDPGFRSPWAHGVLRSL
jgi:hypothetical protein